MADVSRVDNINKNLIDNIHNCEDDNVDIQIYKIISAYVYRTSYISEAFKNNKDKIQDVISTAYLDYLTNYKEKYEPEQSTLSTYVFSIMKYKCPVYFYQVMYDVSSTTARKCVNSYYDKNVTRKLHNMYGNSESLDISYTGVESSAETDEDILYVDKGVADPRDYIDEMLTDNNDEQLYNMFSNIVDNYVYKTKRKNPDMVKDVIMKYTFGNHSGDIKVTLESLGQEWGLTRERIRQILKKFYDFAKNNKEIKNSLGIDYIDNKIVKRKESEI